MRMIKKQLVDGKVQITTESSFLVFWKFLRVFEAQKEHPKGYWSWLELPDRLTVPDSLSFQLDAWNKY